ncbi:MAG TPA: HYR domain-containing protein, partial [Blastocatellia bacterium]|nr:HYR domain-containing protein [Blastocatellia bacterium]
SVTGAVTVVSAGTCAAPPAFAAPIEAEESLKQAVNNSSQPAGGGSVSTLKRMQLWLRPVFSAFVAPTNLSLKALGTWFAPTVKAAENETADLAVSAAMSGETVTKGISIIPPGKTVTITFSVTINTPFPVGVCTVSNQGSVSGSGFSTVLTNSATTTVLLAPTIGSCPTNITTNTDPGLCTAAVTFTTPTATGCPSPTVTCSPASGSAFAKGTTTVTCTATNGVSPNSTCSFTVTVADNQGPTFASCPTNISANTAAGLCTAAVTYIAPTATDACEGTRTVTCLPASGSSFAKGVTTVTCSASDTSGNNNSCSFTVTVADNQGPTFASCPANISKNTDAGLCTAVATYTAPTATDACDGARAVTCSPASGTAFAKGVTTVTCTASDTTGNNGSCSFTVTVADNQGPAVACPGPISVTESPIGSGSATATFSATANDVCDGARTVTCTPASGSSFPLGVTTVNCTASDTSGNPGSCSFTVTVAAGCTITCPGNVTANTAPGQCGANVNYAAPTTGANCGTVTCAPAAGSFFPKGITTVSCTTTAGPACSFTVTVNDNQGPTVSCPGPISVTESPAGSGSATATFSATATDVCDGARTVTCTPASGSSFPLGVTTVSCTASDTSGNPGSCSFTVTVGVACTISCPSNVTADAAAGQCAANVTYSAPTAAAGCGTVTCSPASGSSFTVGTTTVTCSTTAGPSCSFTVTVADHQAPTVTCPANVNAVTDNTSGACSASAVTLGTATAVDNCGGTLTATGTRSDSQPLSAPYPVGVTTITWSATDAAGNTGTCQQTVTVTNSDPVVSITGPASGSLFTVNTPVNFTGSFTDNTGTHTASWTFDTTNVAGVVNESLKTVTASYTFTVPGIYAVTLTVTDNCGGSGSANTIGGINALVVVYDPNGGFVTGGGWINSPAGAYVANPSLTGKANFGFNAKYKQNGGVDSETDFELKAGSFHFHSNNANWLVINGSKAQYQGTGTVDGSSHNYSFVVSVIDGQLAGGGGVDKFRITIWDINTGNTLVYDNQSSTNTSDLPTTPLGGGNIVIHKAGNNQNSPAPAKAISDFDGDGKTDLAVWDGMKTSFWQIVRSSDGGQSSIYWGRAYDPFNDVIAPGDYDGDGKADAAVFRRSTNTWYIKQSSDDQTVAVPFGLGTDTVVPADYDGDGKTDLAVWRAKEGRWLIKRSSDKQTLSIIWGSGRLSYLDVPVPGDYDGDGKADLAVFNPSTSYWLIKSSSDGAVIQKLLGEKGDMPVPADYDGDGKTDIAVWNGDSTYWHIINSSDGSTRDVSWGRSVMNDIPVPGDFDGDGLADIAVWRPATATWYIQLSQSKTVATKQHGSAGFVPIPAGVQR